MNNGEEFRRPNVNDIGMLQNNFNNCEWLTEDYIPSIREDDVDNLRILIINGEIIGIVNFYNTRNRIGRFPLYYVSTECTKDKDKIAQTFDGLKTPGRLLWAYILREIRLNTTERFAVYNHAISDSKGYHLKMGMKPAGDIILIGSRKLKEVVLPLFQSNSNLNTAEIPPLDLVNEFDDTYLFYLSDPRVDYSSIDSILNSLPPPSELHKRTGEDVEEEATEENDRKKQIQIGGIKRKKTKTQNKRKKTQNKRKKTQNKRKNTQNKRKNKKIKCTRRK